MMKEEIKFLIIHCSATKPSQLIHAVDIERWHRARGFLDIGYHYIIPRNGFLENGRSIEEQGAHAQGWNDKSLGICLVGGLNEETWKPENNYTPVQWSTLYSLLKVLVNEYPWIKILGHNEIEGVNKACPCFSVHEWLNSVGLEEYSIFHEALDFEFAATD